MSSDAKLPEFIIRMRKQEQERTNRQEQYAIANAYHCSLCKVLVKPYSSIYQNAWLCERCYKGDFDLNARRR
jgi:hypothetical protein